MSQGKMRPERTRSRLVLVVLAGLFTILGAVVGSAIAVAYGAIQQERDERIDAYSGLLGASIAQVNDLDRKLELLLSGEGSGSIDDQDRNSGYDMMSAEARVKLVGSSEAIAASEEFLRLWRATRESIAVAAHFEIQYQEEDEPVPKVMLGRLFDELDGLETVLQEDISRPRNANGEQCAVLPFGFHVCRTT